MNKTRYLTLGVGFLTGLGVAWLGFSVLMKNKAYVKNEKSWFVCTHVNMDVIADAVGRYARTNSTPVPIELGTLVRAKMLPEWSEIYICPAQYGLTPVRSNYDDAFRSNIFNPSPIAAFYENCSYYVETLSNSFRVRCLYHTNVLDVTTPKNASTNPLR
jgi:hypothetical protein